MLFFLLSLIFPSSSLSLSLFFSGSFPSTVNDAFYAGVKALVAKTTVAFVSSNAATITHGRSEPEHVMISDMIYSSLIAPRPSPTFLSIFFHASAFRLVTCRSFSLLSLSLCRLPRIKWRRAELIREGKVEAGFVCQSGKHRGGLSNDYSLSNPIPYSI